MAELKNKKLGLNIVKIIENIPPKYHIIYTNVHARVKLKSTHNLHRSLE